MNNTMSEIVGKLKINNNSLTYRIFKTQSRHELNNKYLKMELPYNTTLALFTHKMSLVI